MGAQQRIYRRRIKTVQSTKKITRAMELIAVVAHRQGAAAGRGGAPYARELTRAISAAASHTDGDHPLTGPSSG